VPALTHLTHHLTLHMGTWTSTYLNERRMRRA
jgi:hypothetical protein